jgi:hypothetical protein
VYAPHSSQTLQSPNNQLHQGCVWMTDSSWMGDGGHDFWPIWLAGEIEMAVIMEEYSGLNSGWTYPAKTVGRDSQLQVQCWLISFLNIIQSIKQKSWRLYSSFNQLQSNVKCDGQIKKKNWTPICYPTSPFNQTHPTMQEAGAPWTGSCLRSQKRSGTKQSGQDGTEPSTTRRWQ